MIEMMIVILTVMIAILIVIMIMIVGESGPILSWSEMQQKHKRGYGNLTRWSSDNNQTS